METRTIHLLQMGKHFVYLPLYFARERNFFGCLPNIDIKIHNHPSGTDEATTAALFSGDPRYSNIDLILTDPVCLTDIKRVGGKKPAVLASLLTNGAFWAVNHGTGVGDGIRKLGGFNKIISYGSGTTSYNIARRIARESGRIGELDTLLEVVPQGMELDAFIRKSPDDKVVVLSPNLLHIEELVSGGEYRYELAIGDTTEYDNVLVTVLVSTAEFYKNNREVVLGLLKAIQHALLMIRLSHPDLVRFAGDYFPHKERIGAVIQKANDAGIFPFTVGVPRSHWVNAIQASVLSKEGAAGWTSERETQASKTYDEFVAPYVECSTLAVREALESPDLNPPKPSAELRAIHFGCAGLVCIALAAVNPLMALVNLILFCGWWNFWWRKSIMASSKMLKVTLGSLSAIAMASMTVLMWRAPQFPEKWDFFVGVWFSAVSLIIGFWITRERADR